ncbi:MAG: hypothetical protein H0U03_02235 [Actinobacteria bacterium]|nr:hypothetical protein [Actinomycetota bacterium]
MSDWYWIGVLVGLGVAFGVLFAGLLASTRVGLLAAALLGTAAAVFVGLAIDNWNEAVGGAVGGLLGALGAGQVVRRALHRGGTRGGTALLVAGAAVLLAALAFVPVVGYLHGVAVPALAGRLRRSAGRRHAGLRSLARD